MTTVRKIYGDPTVDIEHEVAAFLKSAQEMPTKTVCGISTEGMEPVDWNSMPWPRACLTCAIGVGKHG